MAAQHRTKLVIDIATFVAFLVTMEPRASGIPVHEWLSLAAAAVIVVHLLLNWEWIASVTRRISKAANADTRLNYVLNWALFIDGVLIMLSGLMISRAVLPAFDYTMPRSHTWRELHDVTANTFLVLLGVHVAMHWRWIKTHLTRLVAPILRGGAAQSQEGVS